MNDAEMAAIHAAAMTLPRPWSAAEFAAIRTMPGILCLTLPHAFALGRSAADEAELLTIAVAPEAQRRGTGRRLLDRLHARLAADGTRRIFLEVAETNAAARALYLKAGYAETGRRRGYYSEASPTIDAILMARALAP